MKASVRKSSIAIVTAVSIAINGCATMPASQMSPAEKQLEEQSQWFERTDVQGALIGAILAGGICAAAGGRAGTCVASAAGGAVLGYSAGAYMDSLRKNYSSQEAMLNQALTDIQADNQKISNYLIAEQKVVQEKMAKLESIKHGLEQKTLSASVARSELDKLRQTQDKLAKKASDLSAVQNKWEKTYAMLETHDQRMAGQIGTMKQQLHTIQQDNENYKKALNEVDISKAG